MIGSTLIEQNASGLFSFSSIETRLFLGNVSEQTLIHLIFVRRQRVVGKHLSIHNNRVLMDDKRSSFLSRRIDYIDLSSPIKLAKLRVLYFFENGA